MARIRTRYLRIKTNADGSIRAYWEPSVVLAAAGWKARRLARPDGGAVATVPEAIAAAELINAELDRWRAGKARGPEAIAPAVAPGSLAALIAAYKASPRYTRLAPKTKRDYDWCLRLIDTRWGIGPVRSLTPLAVQEFYTAMYDATPAKANAVVRVLRLLLEFARRTSMVAVNVAAKPGLIGTAPRLRILDLEETTALVAAADAMDVSSIGDAVLLAYYTGQRRGDLLRLPRFHVANGRVRLRQSKRRAQIDVKQTPRLADRLDQAEARIQARWPKATTILVCELTGKPWVEDTFTHTFAQVRARAAKGFNDPPLPPCPSVLDAWFMDLRDTAVTNLAMAGCTIPQICAITGHSERSATSILKHYLALNQDMADSAIAKLVAWEERQQAKAESEGA